MGSSTVDYYATTSIPYIFMFSHTDISPASVALDLFQALFGVCVFLYAVSRGWKIIRHLYDV